MTERTIWLADDTSLSAWPGGPSPELQVGLLYGLLRTLGAPATSIEIATDKRSGLDQITLEWGAGSIGGGPWDPAAGGDWIRVALEHAWHRLGYRRLDEFRNLEQRAAAILWGGLTVAVDHRALKGRRRVVRYTAYGEVLDVDPAPPDAGIRFTLQHAWVWWQRFELEACEKLKAPLFEYPGPPPVDGAREGERLRAALAELS